MLNYSVNTIKKCLIHNIIVTLLNYAYSLLLIQALELILTHEKIYLYLKLICEY
jgi:hypothetical protein